MLRHLPATVKAAVASQYIADTGRMTKSHRPNNQQRFVNDHNHITRDAKIVARDRESPLHRTTLSIAIGISMTCPCDDDNEDDDDVTCPSPLTPTCSRSSTSLAANVSRHPVSLRQRKIVFSCHLVFMLRIEDCESRWGWDGQGSGGHQRACVQIVDQRRPGCVNYLVIDRHETSVACVSEWWVLIYENL